MAVNRNDPRQRNQVVRPRSRKLANPRKPPPKSFNIAELIQSLSAFAKPIALVLTIVLVVVAYHALAGSAVFHLRRVSIAGPTPAVRSEVEQVVKRVVGESGLLDVDLAQVRQKVEGMSRVRSATVGRMLPDGIFVQVVERQPTVLVRRETGPKEGKLIWLDDEAVEIGELSELKNGESDAAGVPPIARGFSEGLRSQVMVAEDRERVALYKQIQKELSEGPNPLWDLIDQVDLTFVKDVNLRLARPPVMIHIGGLDFRKRLERALQVLHSLQQGDQDLPNRYRVQDVDRLIQNSSNINFIDAARSERIVVNFATPGAQRATKQEKKK
jgi:hypothetical protein